VVQFVTTVSGAKTDEPIDMQFGVWIRMDPRHVLGGAGAPRNSGVATGWTGVDMSTPLLLEVAPEVDTNPTSFYRGRGRGVAPPPDPRYRLALAMSVHPTYFDLATPVPGKVGNLRASHGPLRIEGKSGVSQSYSLGGSSDPAFRCQYCSNLLRMLFTVVCSR